MKFNKILTLIHSCAPVKYSEGPNSLKPDQAFLFCSQTNRFIAAYCQSVITPKQAQSRKKLSHYLNP